jgi:hypothetical protein
MSAREQKAVNLAFSIGDADLSVRVELHDGEVRTTFRTDSPELRTALSHEWQAVTATAAGDRSFRVAPALFAASENAAFNAFAGDTSSRQRDPRTAGKPEDRSTFGISRARHGAASTPQVSSTAPLAASRTSHRLHTVA